MAEIKPFRGLRYTGAAGPAGTLTCPPADGAEAGPYSAGRLALCPAEAGPLLQQWLTDSLVKIDMDPAFYLYEQQAPANGRTQTVRGFLALVRLDGSVQPRRTEAGAAEEAELPRTEPCGLFPICAFYRDESGLMQRRLDALSQDTPRYSLQAGGAVHRLWIINDPLRGFHRPHTVRRRRRDAGWRTQRPALPRRAGRARKRGGSTDAAHR